VEIIDMHQRTTQHSYALAIHPRTLRILDEAGLSEGLIAARAPWCTARPTQIYWSTLALFEWRLTRSFGNGGVWLAGDAAHQAAPRRAQRCLPLDRLRDGLR
jgi:2-polyprenyl-6-methoxyphenol hydroxylase-like FAD-dependent oxidoreductase